MINKDLSKASSQFLAAIIVVYKALGLDRDHAIACMNELAKRKNDGDVFDYDKYIDDNLKKFPISKHNDVSSVLKMVKKVIGENLNVK